MPLPTKAKNIFARVRSLDASGTFADAGVPKRDVCSSATETTVDMAFKLVYEFVEGRLVEWRRWAKAEMGAEGTQMPPRLLASREMVLS